MSMLSGTQFAVAGHAIDLSLKFSNAGTSQALVAGPTPLGPVPGDNGGQAGGTSFVPNVYLTHPINDKWTIGLGVNAPFGLKTEYDSTFVGRYQGIKSEITSYNINPAVSYKISDTVALGGGVNYQHLEAKLTNAVFTGGPDGIATLNADDDAWGWNLGLLAQITPDTRVGVSYRSQLKYTLSGTASAGIPGGATLLPTTNISTDVTLPDMASLSVMHKLNDKWDLLGDATFTRWSKLDTLNVISSSGATLDTLPFKFDDSWRLSLGANYHYSERWTFKGGVAWDQTPVQDQYRTVRLPDNDRKWLSFGGKYKVSQNGAIDFGYSHLFISNASINNTKVGLGGAVTSTVVGTYEGSIDILSLQYSQAF
jgi:long-chain fatty acid transport protein